jgi:hypothetical protein
VDSGHESTVDALLNSATGNQSTRSASQPAAQDKQQKSSPTAGQGALGQLENWIKGFVIKAFREISGTTLKSKDSEAAQAKELKRNGLEGEVGTSGIRTDVGKKVNETIQETAGTVAAKAAGIAVGAAVSKGTDVLIEALPETGATLVKGAEAMRGVREKQEAIVAVGKAAAGRHKLEESGSNP